MDFESKKIALYAQQQQKFWQKKPYQYVKDEYNTPEICRGLLCYFFI